MTDGEKILVFVPSYNCENQITRVIDQFRNQNLYPKIDTVLIINNCSTDSTEQTAINNINDISTPKINVLRNDDNYGLGGTHKVAFDYAIYNSFDYVIILHGDDQGNIEDISRYLRKENHLKYDAFLGARFHPDSKLVGYSKFRTFGNIVFNLFFSLFLGKRIYDLGAGLNCYNVNILRDKFYLGFPDDLTFNYCMVMAHIYYGHNIKFFPLTWTEDDQISNVKLASQAKKVLKMLFQFVTNRSKFIRTDLRKKQIENYTYQDVGGNC